MGERFPNLPPPVRVTTDVTVVSTTMLGFFQAIPWPSIAAALACVYTIICIIQALQKWRRKK